MSKSVCVRGASAPRAPSFDTILAALTVVSIQAVTSGCSKPIDAEKPSSATSPTPTSTGTSTTPAPIASAAAVPQEPALAVDAGVERNGGPKAAPGKNGSAACGAQGCSPEMKKQK